MNYLTAAMDLQKSKSIHLKPKAANNSPVLTILFYRYSKQAQRTRSLRRYLFSCRRRCCSWRHLRCFLKIPRLDGKKCRNAASADELKKLGEQEGRRLNVQVALEVYFKPEVKSVVMSANRSFVEIIHKPYKNGLVFLTNKRDCSFTNIKKLSRYNYSKNNSHFPSPKRLGRQLLYCKKSLLNYRNKLKGYSREPH